MGEFHEARFVRTVEFENIHMHIKLFRIGKDNYLSADAFGYNINVYDANGMIISRYIDAHRGCSFYTVLSDNTLVVGSYNGEITFWEYESKRAKLKINLNTSMIHKIYELDNRKEILVVSASNWNKHNKRQYEMQRIQIDDGYPSGPGVCVSSNDTHSIFTEMSNDSFYMVFGTTWELIYMKFNANTMFDPENDKVTDRLSQSYKTEIKRSLSIKKCGTVCNFEKIENGSLIFGFTDGSIMIYDEDTEARFYDQNIHRQSDIVCAEKGVFVINYSNKGLCKIYDGCCPAQDIEGIPTFSILSKLRNEKNGFYIAETSSRLKFYEICYRFCFLFFFFFFYSKKT